MTGFHLTKWYLDCVTADGDVFIGYSALLSFKALHLTFSNVLTFSASGAVESKVSFGSSPIPRSEGDTIRWTCPQLHVGGRWRARCAPVASDLYERDGGVLRWSCLQPAAEVSVVRGSDLFAGLGYAECLELSIPPWELPISELRWGRFVSESEALVWIDWRGAHPLTCISHNGSALTPGRVTDESVQVEGISLDLTDRTVIRHEPLLSLGLDQIPGMKKLIPLRMLRADECKWRSRGIFSRPDAPPSSGWTIHEIVRFL